MAVNNGELPSDFPLGKLREAAARLVGPIISSRALS